MNPNDGQAVAARTAAPRNALEDLTDLVTEDLGRVNALILQHMQSPVALIPQLAGYILAAGGKRLRPVLTLACARLCGGNNERSPGLAASVELIHTATLLHDDVVDESDRRRGRASANAVFGNESSVLVGDFLFSRAFELMTADGSIDVLRILSRASAVIAEGEVLQLATANDLATTEESYLRVIESKTAALFAAACEVGAYAADKPDLGPALATYGRALGLAFQIVDDVLDYVASEARLGKAIGDDFKDGKVTLPVILAYQRGSETERVFWRRCIEDQELEDADLDRAIGLLRQHKALDQSFEVARGFAVQAKSALLPLPINPYRTALAAVADFCVDRDF
jgi:octaprenyl-diphosphate synthase